MSNVASRSRRRAHRLTRDFTQAEWADLLLRASYRCVYCGAQLTDATATVDHAYPLSRGGSNGVVNLLPACLHCNREKGSRTAEEFVGRERARLIRKRLHSKEPFEATVLRRALYGLAVAYLNGERGSGEAILALLRASGLPAEAATRTLTLATRAKGGGQ